MSELKNEQSLKTKCPACNASISFNPKLGLWKCDYCGSEFTLEEINKSNNANQTKEVTKKYKKILIQNIYHINAKAVVQK